MAFEHPSQFYGGSVGSDSTESFGKSNLNPRYKSTNEGSPNGSEVETSVYEGASSTNPRYKPQSGATGGDSEDKASTKKRFWPGKGKGKRKGKEKQNKIKKPKFAPLPPSDSRRESEEKDDEGWRDLVEEEKKRTRESGESFEEAERMPQPIEQVMQRGTTHETGEQGGSTSLQGFSAPRRVPPDMIICCCNLSAARRWVVDLYPSPRLVPGSPTNVVHMNAESGFGKPTLFQRSISMFSSLTRSRRDHKSKDSFLVDAEKKYATIEEGTRVSLSKSDEGGAGKTLKFPEDDEEEELALFKTKPVVKNPRKVRMSIFQIPKDEDIQEKKKRDSIKAAQEFADDLEREEVRKQLEKLL